MGVLTAPTPPLRRTDAMPDWPTKVNIIAIYALSTLVCGLLVYATYVDFVR